MERSRATGPCGYRSRCDFDNQRLGLGGVPPESERSRGRYDSQAPRAGDVVPKASRNGTGSKAQDLAQGDAVRRRCATRVPPRGLFPLGAVVVYLPARPATTRKLRRPVVDGGSSSRVPGEKSTLVEPEQKVGLIHDPHLSLVAVRCRRAALGSIPVQGCCRRGATQQTSERVGIEIPSTQVPGMIARRRPGIDPRRAQFRGGKFR